MNKSIEINQTKLPFLEKFGLFYLNRFRKQDLKHNVFDFNDAELKSRVDKIERKGIVLSAIIGIACVFPTIWISVHFANANTITYWSWFLGVTIVSIIIEFYVLFIIALKAVFEVSELINMHAREKDFLSNGVFSVQHILARTALELPDPELKILGIDPFEKISKKNLFVLGLLYKAKIIVTNFVLKYALRFTIGTEFLGISILYEALPVEAFWNGVVLKRVVHEARLRLFGFALANHIADNVIKDKLLQQLSPQAKIGCIRAIGNAVVMAQSYHPNMIILLLKFQQLLDIKEENKYDDWDLFLQTVKSVSEKERYFLLDLFTISAAFDGRVSSLEEENLRAVYVDEYDLYYPRLIQLTRHLKHGELNAAYKLCRLDFTEG